jgi:transcriptional regulator with XRE-family HTH domain
MSREVLNVANALSVFMEDFIWNDRRLAETTDLTLTVEREGDLSGLFISIEPILVGDNCVGLEGKCGDSLLRITTDRALSMLEQNKVHELLVVALYATAKRGIAAVFPLGILLQIARLSLGLSIPDLAAELRTDTRSVSRWENPSPLTLPTPSFVYRWCQALGLVCPPKTALVRVVDFSPLLLRFLREDPSRLRSLTPEEFERFVANRLDRMGYSVTLTGATNRKDGGIDLIAVPKSANLGSLVIAGQVKHHEGDQKTGREAVDRILAWKDSRYFGVGLLATNTAFTKDAIWTAQQERNARFLRLRDFSDLKRWLQDQWGTEDDWREIPNKVELAPGVVIEIPRPRIATAFEEQEVGRLGAQADAEEGFPV